MNRSLLSLCAAITLAALPIALSGQAAVAPALEPKVDAVFAKWTASTPGCAVGVSAGGSRCWRKATGWPISSTT